MKGWGGFAFFVVVVFVVIAIGAALVSSAKQRSCEDKGGVSVRGYCIDKRVVIE